MKWLGVLFGAPRFIPHGRIVIQVNGKTYWDLSSSVIDMLATYKEPDGGPPLVMREGDRVEVLILKAGE